MGTDKSPGETGRVVQLRATGSSFVISFFLVAIVIAAFIYSSDSFDHWFVLPISFCGVLMGTDALEWARGRVGLYDPVGFLGCFGVHFFFVAPLLYVKWDSFAHDLPAPPDWRDWLGYMALLNALGLLGYKLFRSLFQSRQKARQSFWELDRKRFRRLLPVFLLVSVTLQLWTYLHFGGIAGYMQARFENAGAFKGMGWLFMISEAAPVLVAFSMIIYFQGRKVGWFRLGGALIALFAIQMLFGGLRGSRSETVQLLFWIVGCIHFMIRPVPRKLIAIGCVCLIVFMYVYGLYKDLGPNAFRALSQPTERERVSLNTRRTYETVILNDLARADLQAFILYRLIEDDSKFVYAKGRSYLAAVSLIAPSSIIPERPESIVKEGTDIQIGEGGYVPGYWWSSRVYGLAGEAMLNFGPLSVPVMYALFGLFVGWFRHKIAQLLPGDARLLLVPFAVFLSGTLLAGDSDNVTFTLVKNGFIPLLVVVLCAARRKNRAVADKRGDMLHVLTSNPQQSRQLRCGARPV